MGERIRYVGNKKRCEEKSNVTWQRVKHLLNRQDFHSSITGYNVDNVLKKDFGEYSQNYSQLRLKPLQNIGERRMTVQFTPQFWSRHCCIYVPMD